MDRSSLGDWGETFVCRQPETNGKATHYERTPLRSQAMGRLRTSKGPTRTRTHYGGYRDNESDSWSQLDDTGHPSKNLKLLQVSLPTHDEIHPKKSFDNIHGLNNFFRNGSLLPGTYVVQNTLTMAKQAIQVPTAPYSSNVRYSVATPPNTSCNMPHFGSDLFGHGFEFNTKDIDRLPWRYRNVQAPLWMTGSEIDQVLSAVFGHQTPSPGDIVIHCADRDCNGVSVHYLAYGRRVPSSGVAEDDPPEKGSTPASSTAIAQLQEQRLSEDDIELACGICMESQLGHTIIVLPCIHWFCKDCTDLWLRHNATCPTCRRPIGAAKGTERTLSQPNAPPIYDSIQFTASSMYYESSYRSMPKRPDLEEQWRRQYLAANHNNDEWEAISYSQWLRRPLA